MSSYKVQYPQAVADLVFHQGGVNIVSRPNFDKTYTYFYSQAPYPP